MTAIDKSESVNVTVIDSEPCKPCPPCPPGEECEECEECETCEECEECEECETCDEIYKVTFISDGKTVYESLFAAGSKLSKPKLAPREDYTFEGWYSDKNFVNAWNFETDVVTANVTLYAKWTTESGNDFIEMVFVEGGTFTMGSTSSSFF